MAIVAQAATPLPAFAQVPLLTRKEMNIVIIINIVLSIMWVICSEVVADLHVYLKLQQYCMIDF